MSKVRILVVDDEKLIRWTLERRLISAGYAVLTAGTAADALKVVGESAPDLILLDVNLPDREGIEILPEIRESAPDAQIIVITAFDSPETALRAFRDGVEDYVTKPFDFRMLDIAIHRVLEKLRLRRQISRSRSSEQELYDMGRIVGESASIRNLIDLTHKIAVSDATTVLLTGESGTGKDLVARTIHARSARRERPFMAINCTAITETLLESELMGHEKGAFTDARSRKPGLFEVADGGTVFLDEIGDMRAGLQAKLLSMIEDKSIRRVGGTETIQVDVRIIAATNRDLAQAIRDGEFREDLYYRLKVFPLHLPPLRDRKGDIPLLAKSLVRDFNRKYKRSISGITDAARELLESYDWPGNVRELRNVLERAIILRTDGEIDVSDLPAELAVKPKRAPAASASTFVLPEDGVSLESVERDLIRQALDRTEQNQTRAAKLLHLTRDALRYRMKKFGLR
jgi:two-component system, NtrC family, response regulator AtoC